MSETSHLEISFFRLLIFFPVKKTFLVTFDFFNFVSRPKLGRVGQEQVQKILRSNSWKNFHTVISKEFVT